ncbi:uncharacterized protein STEHIDRAFT_126410 [Stereum hirsutum FP-91666 SS1]|uniref:DUF6534 domain-containing protein n=1 Tax=Stereum hirsutum (strain FP-91666) TaxID=721885 RepID=R7RZJ7_STEHR|nr:uncharacterized protein STEHIDRAFT_126410 [Stereum hirsutum FP-91666 SS1]EIM79737.1 hypothetical protein STEHIDRAFT_126410 [Stereum hirsutum FP-91666 SS1]
MATNTTCAPVDADIAALLGPPLIGSFVGWGLFGISVMQTYFYYLSFPEDPSLLKTYVYGMFTLELFHTIIISVGTWDSVIQGWGNLEFIIFGGWTYASIPVISGIAGAFAQAFFAWRIYVLGRRSRTWLVVVASIMVLSVTQMSGGIAAGVVLAQRNDQVSEKERLILANLWLAGSAACDILIALSLTFLLWRARQKSREAGVVASRSDVILTRLITMTAETGATTAIIQVVDLILFLAFPDANYHEATAYILSKLYYNSLIASLNSRASIFRPEPSAYSTVSGMVYTQQSSSQNGMRVRRATGQSGVPGPVVHVTTYTEDDRSRMADDGDRKRGVSGSPFSDVDG